MFAKSVLFCFAQALFVQSISSQCIGTPYEIMGAPWTAAPYSVSWGAPATAPYGAIECGVGFVPAASNGGGFAVTSISPIAPTGVYVTSENAYDGAVAVTGKLPFLSAVALEGSLPTVGAGAISYGCGNGNIGIMSEDFAPAGYGVPAGYGAPLGYGAPVAALAYGAPLAEGYGYNGVGGFGYPGCGYY